MHSTATVGVSPHAFSHPPGSTDTISQACARYAVRWSRTRATSKTRTAGGGSQTVGAVCYLSVRRAPCRTASQARRTGARIAGRLSSESILAH
jgi:hypothetical protein